eukprot:Phypoly_transcript_03175.p1 GENE.Phypoly_transcript_03175~~Phypoly_transcript_03175.p1  ORF type:complete len:843 (+),score=112.98 Phypoly_transcript_03175:152-2530(+)
MTTLTPRSRFSLQIPPKSPDFSSTLDVLSARDISAIEHVLFGVGVEKGFAKDEHVSFFVEDKAKLDLHKRGYNLKAKVFIETISTEIPTTVFDLKNGNYRISYRRSIPGTYLIDVWLVSSNKQLIPTVSKKVIVDAEFPYESKYQEHFIHCLDPNKTSIVLEQHANSYSFFIETRNWRGGPIKEGGARFAAALTYMMDKSDIPVTIEDNKDGTYRANFTPTKSGRYRLDLHLMAKRNAAVRVHGSPLEVTLVLHQNDMQIDIRHTAIDKNLLRGKRVNDQITIMIQAKDKAGNNILIGGGSFVAYITGPAGNTKLRIIDNEDGTYTSTFKAKTSGNYILSVKFCDEDDEQSSLRHLHGSPFTFNVATAEFDLSPALTEANGPGLVGGQTGKFTYFNVFPRNKKGDQVREGGAQVFVKITYGLAVKEIFADVRDDENGAYHVSYVPKFHGRHKIYVYLVDDKGKRLPISGSPFVVDIDPPIQVPVAAYTTAFGLGLQVCKILHETKFFIQARNNSRGEIAVKKTDFTGYLIGSNRKQIPVKISENADGTLTAAYSVPTPGSYKCYILLQENEDAIFENEEDRYISGVPFTIEALDVVDISKCKVSNLDPEAQYLLAPTTFTVFAKNKDGEALITGGEQFDVIIQGPKGSVSSSIYDKSDGTYDVTFVPKAVGIHKIWISHEGKDFNGCPYIIDVDEAADSEQSSTVQYMFVVQMRTKNGASKTTGGDFFEVTVTGPEGPIEDVHVIDVGDGSVLVKYSLFKPAEYWVKVVLNGKTLKGFPFLHIMPKFEREEF